jgi:hypothetical protein
MSVGNSLDEKRIKAVIEDCLKRIPKTEYQRIPDVLTEPGQTTYSLLITDEFAMVNFTNSDERNRLSEIEKRGLFPYPGLIKPDPIKMASAFRFEKTKNVMLEKCSVNNMYSLSLGKDSTIVLRDHKQSIKTEELNLYVYTIKLAYIISFGDQITHNNFYDLLKELMLYSFRQWGIALA